MFFSETDNSCLGPTTLANRKQKWPPSSSMRGCLAAKSHRKFSTAILSAPVTLNFKHSGIRISCVKEAREQRIVADRTPCFI